MTNFQVSISIVWTTTIDHEVKTHNERIITVFPYLEENFNDHNWLCERAI